MTNGQTDRIEFPRGFVICHFESPLTLHVTPRTNEAITPATTRMVQTPRPARYGFIDLLRGMALVVMIETHVVNAYLEPESKKTLFFFGLTFFNGLVAPAFLFAAGFSLILQMNRNREEWLAFGRPVWINLRRLGFITLVAYYTHLHQFKWSKYVHPETPDVWKETLQVDILQCIVASLLILQALLFIFRKRALFAWAAGCVAPAVSLLTPWMWAQDFAGRVPLALALFLNPHGISLFPLFPWLSFVLCGGIAAHLFLNSVERNREIRHVRHVFVLGVFLICGGLLAPYTVPGHENFYTTSPHYVSVRLGCVLILCAFFYGMEKLLHLMPEPIRIAGQESLLVYGVHLWLIFGVLRGKHLGPVLGLQAGYPVCFALSGAIIVLMLWLARGWQKLKRSYPEPVKRTQAAVVILMILIFLLR